MSTLGSETADLVVDSEFTAPNIRAMAAELLACRAALATLHRRYTNPVLREVVEDALQGRLSPELLEKTRVSNLKPKGV